MDLHERVSLNASLKKLDVREAFINGVCCLLSSAAAEQRPSVLHGDSSPSTRPPTAFV